MPIETTLQTQWADETQLDVPLPDHPRPMLVRDDWLNLNGAWDYAIVRSQGHLVAEQPPLRYDGTIQVPFALETVASGVTQALSGDETLFYRRHVSWPAAFVGRRLALNFEAIDHESVIRVDGIVVGEHRGGYEPFSVVLPEVGESSEIVVAVRDPGPTGGQQYGKQADEPADIWYTATSGIWQTVWAEPLPTVAITRVTSRTWPTRDGFDLIVEAEGNADVIVTVTLPDGSECSVTGDTSMPIAIALESPRVWTPDDPHLYQVTVTTGDDTITTWVGLRTVKLGPIPGASATERFAVLLNGEAVLLNTPLDQGYWPESGMTAPSDAALIFDLEQMKSLGFNGVRKHIKVESRRFYHHADRLGMLVAQDVVNGGQLRVSIKRSAVVMALDLTFGDTSAKAHAAAGRSDPRNRVAFEADLAAMIRLLDPHPSVIMWVIFNEAWGQYDTNRIEADVRALDPTRLIDATSGWLDQGGGDFRSRHRYVLTLVAPPKKDRRPFNLSEFGGYNLAVDGHLWEGAGRFGYRFFATTAALDEALGRLWRRQLIPLVNHGLRSCVYTQVSDVEIETNGLFTYDRRVLKPSAAQLRTLNAELAAAFAALGSTKGS